MSERSWETFSSRFLNSVCRARRVQCRFARSWWYPAESRTADLRALKWKHCTPGHGVFLSDISRNTPKSLNFYKIVMKGQTFLFTDRILQIESSGACSSSVSGGNGIGSRSSVGVCVTVVNCMIRSCFLWLIWCYSNYFLSNNASNMHLSRLQVHYVSNSMKSSSQTLVYYVSVKTQWILVVVVLLLSQLF